MNHLFGRPGFLLCSPLIAALAGCTTYVESPPPAAVYAPPPVAEQPPPAVVYAPPPPAYVAPQPADAAVVTIQTASDFYEPLNPYGEWVTVGSYGRCWRPARVEAGWRPYCNGYWQRTDAGWFWASDEPWAWATYHYGRWDWTVNFGWIWVPQTQWAPSWVAWREGAGYVGWAPLPPTATIAVSGGVVFRDAAYAPRAFVFVEERRLLEPVRPATVIVNNTIVVNKTVNITKIRVVNKTVINDGPRPDVIERVSGRRIQPVAVHELRHKQEADFVARRQNVPANVPREVRPPARAGSEPGKGVLPRTPPQPERAPETGRGTPPVVRHDQAGQMDEHNPSPQPSGPPGLERPAHDGNKPETVPATTRHEVKPEPKPEVLHREGRPVEKPAEAVKQPQPPPAKNQAHGLEAQKPAPARIEGDKPMRKEQTPGVKAGTGEPEATRKSVAQPGGKQNEGQLKSPKEKAVAKEPVGADEKQKDRTRKGEPPEKPASSPPPQ